MYTLWSIKTGKAVAGFDTEHEALAMIEDAVAKFGTHYVDDLALDLEDDEGGRSIPIGDGAELLKIIADWLAPQTGSAKKASKKKKTS